MEDKLGNGDLQVADILNLNESKTTNMFKNRFVKYKKLVEEIGDEAAFEK